MNQFRLPLVAFAAALLISILRDPQALLLPILYCEDGPNMFAFYYNNRQLAGLLEERAGYLSLLPNMIGYAVCALPTALIAPALVVGPLLLAALSFSAFSWPQFRGLVADDRRRAFMCVVLAALPIGNFALLTNTTYSQNSLLILVVLLSLGRLPERGVGKVVQTLLLALAIPCHPLTTLAVPIYLVQIARQRRSPAHVVAYVVLLGAAVAYFFLATEGSDPRTVSVPGTALYTLVYVGLRVVMHTILGMDARIWFESNATPMVFWAVPVMIALAYAFLLVRLLRRRDHATAGWMLGTGYYVVTFSAAAIVVRPLSATVDWYQRYSYIQSVLFGLLAIGLVYRLGTGLRRWILFAVLPLLLVWSNWNNTQYYCSQAVSPDEGEKVRQFLDELADREASAAPGDRIQLRLERGIWSIDLDRVKDW